MKGYYKNIPKFIFPRQSNINLHYMNFQILFSYIFIRSTSSLLKQLSNSQNMTLQALSSSGSYVKKNVSYIDLFNKFKSMKDIAVIKELLSLLNISKSILLTNRIGIIDK